MEKRYSSIDELITDFDRAKEPGILSKLHKNWKSITTAALIGASALGAGTIPVYNAIKREHLIEKAEADKYEVVAAVDGINLEVGNNLFEMEVMAFKPGSPGNPSPYAPTEVKYLEVEPGEKIFTSASLISKPLPQRKESQWGIPSLEGRVYIEGSEGKKLSVSPRGFNGAVNHEMGMGDWNDSSKTIEIPVETKPGNYRLVTEFYAPEENGEYVEKANLKFKQLGKIIARKSIPITVGKDTLPFGLRSLTLGFPNTVYFGPHKPYERSNEPGLKAISEVVGGARMESDNNYVGLHLIPCKNGSKRVVKLELQHHDQTISRTVAIVEMFHEKSNVWDHYLPDKNFYKTLQNIIPFPQSNSDK